MSDDIRAKYYQRDRFQYPLTDPGVAREVISPYDMPTNQLQDLKQRTLAPFEIITLDLNTAGFREFKIPGQALVAYGFETSDGFLRTVDTTASLQFFPERTWPGPAPTPAGAPLKPGFPLKHARGFRGPFTEFTLSWLAQPGVSVDLVIHRFVGQHWIDGESPT